MNISFLCISMHIDAPTKPLNVTATTTDTTATLSWEPPFSNGGREDVFYTVKYKASLDEEFTYYSPTPPITGTFATVTSLVPLTTYTFMVVAENGVSEEFSDQFPESSRTSSSIFVVTKEPCESNTIMHLWRM